MKTATALAPELASSPYADDPVGTLRPQLDFADDRDNPTKFADPYVGRSAGPLEQILGIPILTEREASAAEDLGYDPAKAFFVVSDASGVTSAQRGEDGHLYIEDGEELARVTDEVWAAFWFADGNDPEDGGLTDHQVTLVRII